MNTYNLHDDIRVFGFEVKSFPEKISAAFDELTCNTGESAGERSYFGFTKLNKQNEIAYYAAAEEKAGDEAEKFGYEKFVIPKGDYLTETINDWRTKTNSIQEVFHGMMQDNRADKAMPCVEWYKNENEMWCMIGMKA